MFEGIDPRNPTPLYAQIATRIRVAVASGEVRPGDALPSAWLDCGHGMAEVYADQYQVTFSMATRVMPIDSTRSTIESIIRASARPRDVSTEPFRCSSLGTLEIRIAEMIRQRAGTRR